MTKELHTNESADMRRAFERLQLALERLGDRYHDLRRERKRLMERIQELEQERSNAGLSVSAQMEAAAGDRRRLTEAEERTFQAEKRLADLYEKIDRLEQDGARRDMIIAEQEDSLNLLTEERDETARTAQDAQTEVDLLRRQLEDLRGELARANAESLSTRTRIAELNAEQSSKETSTVAEIARLTAELNEARRSVAALRDERIDMEDRYLQTIAKLDASTRDATISRNRVAELENGITLLEDQVRRSRDVVQFSEERQRELLELRERLRNRDIEVEALRSDLTQAIQRHTGALHELKSVQADLLQSREVQVERERALLEARASTVRLKDEYEARLAAYEEKHVAFDVEAEVARKAMHELQTERDEARSTVESLLVRLKQQEATDDDRLVAQRERIDHLMHDLSEALDMAARKETELIHSHAEVGRLQQRCVDLNDKVEALDGESGRLRAELEAAGERAVALDAETERLRAELEVAGEKVEELDAEAGRLRAELEAAGEAAEGEASVGEGIPEEMRREMVEHITNAITLLDRHLPQ